LSIEVAVGSGTVGDRSRDHPEAGLKPSLQRRVVPDVEQSFFK
jgi:hypothetical protein